MYITTLSTQRSGTKLFSSILRTYSQILCMGEIFNPNLNKGYSFRKYLSTKTWDEIHKSGSEEILSEYLGDYQNLSEILHFDIMFNQLEFMCSSWGYIETPTAYKFLISQASIVVLLTRDTLDSFISNEILKHTHTPHFYVGDTQDIHFPEVIHVSRSDFANYKTEVQIQYDTVRRRFANYLYFTEIDYAQIQQADLPEQMVNLFIRRGRDFGEHFDPSLRRPLSQKLRKNEYKPEIIWTE